MSSFPIGLSTAVSRYPAATREHHDDFCVAEKWDLARGASGKPVTHHRTYTLPLWDGRILRTRISNPVDSSTYSRSMWGHILTTQLEVTTSEFWSCVKGRTLPDRGAPAPIIPDRALPLHLYRQLKELGVEDREIALLGPIEAAQRIAAIYLGQQPGAVTES